MRPPRRRDQARLDAEIEHRRRADAAPRLRDTVVQLESLRLRFEDLQAAGRVVALSYVRPIVVATAPAYFEVRCMEPRCNGRHDLTRAVLHELRQAKPVFEGRSDCDGSVGNVPCDRTLVYSGEADYRA